MANNLTTIIIMLVKVNAEEVAHVLRVSGGHGNEGWVNYWR